MKRRTLVSPLNVGNGTSCEPTEIRELGLGKVGFPSLSCQMLSYEYVERF